MIKNVFFKITLYVLIFAPFPRLGSSEPGLNVPPAPPNAKKGSEIVSMLSPLSLAHREAVIFNLFAQGNVPEFSRKLRPVFARTEIGGVIKNATFYVTPDYLAIGTDDDYFLTPVTPTLAQQIADLAGCFLPTRKMVDDIYRQAQVKLPPSPIPPSDQMTSVKVFDQHNQTVWNQRKGLVNEYPLGALVAGNKKDMVITNKIHDYKPPPRVAIYGWHQPDGKPIQPLSLVHRDSYADYSHGVRLISLSMIVSGVFRNAFDVLADAELSALLSDEGVIAHARYPVPKSPQKSPNQISSSLVLNGSFEGGFKMGLGRFWSRWENKDFPGIIAGEARKNSRDGKFSQYWSGENATGFDGGVYQIVTVIPGAVYEISAWLKRQSELPGTFMAFGYDLDGGVDGSAPSVVYTNLSKSVENEWVPYKALVKSAGKTLTLFSRGGYAKASGSDKAFFYLDNVSLIPAVFPLTPAPVFSPLEE